MRGWAKTTTIDGDNPVIGDMHLTDGDSTIVEGDAATAQELRSRVLLFRGSYFLDLREGLPWFQEILTKGSVPGRVRELFREALLTHPAIVDVPMLRLAIERATRAASLVFEARTTTGTVIRSEDFGPVSIGGAAEIT